MEPWEKSKTEELKKVVARLLKQKSKLLKQFETRANKKKPEILEKLEQICDNLNIKYRQLKIFSKVDFTTEINDILKKQIEYYEQWLDFLKEKVKLEGIPYSYFLKLANLKYEFFDLNREEIINKAKNREGVFVGVSFIPVLEVDTIINIISLAMHNVQKIIQEKRQTMDYDTLYIYFELYGDLFISIHALETEIKEFSAFAELYNINNAFECYEKASEYKSKIELPSIYRGGLVGVKHVKPFFNFFENLDGSIYNVDHKKNHVYKKFENYLTRKIKSFCWKTGDYCDYKKDVIYTLNEGSGVFISMNYLQENNFRLFSYIEKILNYFKLRPILKQDRIRSPSWTKEICCTIYNNKYALVFLDKYSPNVVLELGVCLGMGRKTIILVNETNGTTEQKLFSMIKYYYFITYKNVNNLFEKLIHSINGIYFNNIDYKVPKIHEVLKENEVEDLNKLIKTYWD